MPAIKLILDGDGCWQDLPEKAQQGKFINLMGNNAPPIQMAALPGGMLSGKMSVTFRFELPDDHVLLSETSLELLGTCVRAIEAKYEDALAKSPNANPITRLKQVLSRIEEIANENPLSPAWIGFTSAIAMARAELEKLQRQQAEWGFKGDDRHEP